MSDFTLSPSRSRLRDRQTQRTTNILSLPNAWAGEGISFQSLPDQAQTHRDRECALFNRAADQNLVSEPTHEMEEREQPDLHGDRNWTDRSVSRAGTQWRNGRREGWRQEERIAKIIIIIKNYKNHTMTITNQHNYLKIYMDSRATSPHDCYHAALPILFRVGPQEGWSLEIQNDFSHSLAAVLCGELRVFCFCFVFYCKYHTCIVEIKRSINFYISSYARKSVYLPSPLSHTPSITVNLFDHLTIIQCWSD